MCAASDFCPASELPASPSREAQLEDLVRTQALALERLEALLDGPQQSSGGKLSSQEKAAIIQALSNLEARIKDLEAVVKAFPVDEMELIRDRLVALNKQLEDAEGHFGREIALDRKRLSQLEHPIKTSDIGISRAELIRKYIQDNGTPRKFIDRNTRKEIEGRVVYFEMLRLHLACDKWQLNRALAVLFDKYPGEYSKKKLKGRKWALIELPKL